MNNVFNYIFKITSNSEKVVAGMNKLNGSVQKIEASTVKMDKKFQQAFNNLRNDLKTIKISSIIEQVERVSNGLDTLNKPGMELSTSMYDLSAMTGVAGDKLKEIEGYARASAKTFGGSAADGAESYKLILGQLTPEIAKVPKALNDMGKSVAVTSKLMGGDQVAATEVLTTAMNQYQVSLDDPIKASAEMAKMMNVMAAAAGEGSAELPQIKQALEQSGMAAKGAKVSFEETNAAIQVLDKAGKKGSEGGVALRNVMATLSKGRFLPKNVKEELQAAGVDIRKLSDTTQPLASRLKALTPIMNDSALVSALFGMENANAANALMSSIPEIERLTKAVSGTNTAYEQAAIIMESPLEKNKRLQAQIDDFKISMFNATGGLMGYASVLGQTASDVSNLMPLISGMGTVISTLSSKQKLLALWTNAVSVATGIWTTVQGVFNAVMALNPIVWVVAAVLALIAVIAWVATSTEGWGAAWDHTVKGAKLLFQAFVEGVKNYFNTMVNAVMLGINVIKEGWYEFKEAMGIGDSSENQKMIAQIHADTEKRKQAIIDGAKKVNDLAMKAKDEFVLAGQSIKWKKGAEKTEEGISPPKVPGTAETKPGSFGNGEDKKTKANEAVATGGTKHNYITIHLGEMIGIKTEKMSGSKSDIEKVGTELQDTLIRVLASATTAGN